MSLKSNLATRLKALRKLQGKTVVEFSDSLGIAKSTLQELEAGRGNPTLGTIALMEKSLGVEEGFLLAGKAASLSAAQADARQLLAAIPALGRLSPRRRAEACRLLIELSELLDGNRNDGD